MKSFNEMYEEIYKESNLKLESFRRKIMFKYIMYAIISLLFLIPIVKVASSGKWILMLLVIICYIIVTYIVLIRKNPIVIYQEVFKNLVIEKIVKEYNNSLCFLGKQGASKLDYLQGEYEKFDKYKSEDSIIGVLNNGCKIYMAEVYTKKEIRDSEGNTTYETLFSGLFAKVELKNLIPRKIKIRKDKIIELFDLDKKMNMDSSEFEKYFTVYTQDELIAMQVLTADIMQILLDFKNKYNYTPEITIKSNMMYIRFDTGNMFEGKILKKALDFDTLLEYYQTINGTLGLLEKLTNALNELEI